jgi:hypothetical protein
VALAGLAAAVLAGLARPRRDGGGWTGGRAVWVAGGGGQIGDGRGGWGPGGLGFVCIYV